MLLCNVLQGDFVAAFAQSNEGDVSPNTKGARCTDTGKKCDFNSSTCDGKVSNSVVKTPYPPSFSHWPSGVILKTRIEDL